MTFQGPGHSNRLGSDAPVRAASRRLTSVRRVFRSPRIRADHAPVLAVAGQDLEQGLGQPPETGVIGQLVAMEILHQAGPVLLLPEYHGPVKLVDQRIGALGAILGRLATGFPFRGGANARFSLAGRGPRRGRVKSMATRRILPAGIEGPAARRGRPRGANGPAAGPGGAGRVAAVGIPDGAGRPSVTSMRDASCRREGRGFRTGPRQKQKTTFDPDSVPRLRPPVRPSDRGIRCPILHLPDDRVKRQRKGVPLNPRDGPDPHVVERVRPLSSGSIVRIVQRASPRAEILTASVDQTHGTHAMRRIGPTRRTYRSTTVRWRTRCGRSPRAGRTVCIRGATAGAGRLWCC